MKNARITSIDSLKGIACLVLALLWHYLNMQSKHLGMPLQSIFGIFYDYGQYFVELFFMISGFVMAYCYRDRISEGLDFLPYMAKRFRHLYPLFFTTLMYMLIFQILYYSVSGSYYIYKVSVWHFILNLFCVQTGWITTDQSFNGPAWCISVEIFLYFIYYVTTKASSKDRNYNIIISFALFILATIVVYMDNWNLPILNSFMMRGVSCFYGGVVLCELNDWMDMKKKERVANALLLLFIVFRISLLLTPDYEFWETEKNGRMMLILMEWPILIFASINHPYLKKVLNIAPLRFLGAISMDVFLWHIPVQITIKSADIILGLNIDYGSFYIWLLYATIVLIVSTVSNRINREMKVENYLVRGLITVMCCAIILVGTEATGIRFWAILDNNLSYENHSSTVCMGPGVSTAEEFYSKERTRIHKIQFYTITWGKTFAQDQKIRITITNEKTKEIVFRTERSMNLFKDASIYELLLDDPVELDSDTRYIVSLESNTEGQQEVMALMTTNSSRRGGQAYINGNEIGEHVAIKIWVKK